MVWKTEINPDAGPHRVTLTRGEFIDEARAAAEGSGRRMVPYKIYAPDLEAPHKAPVIIWSHGFGGNRDGASFLSRYLASHGYIVAHPSHHGTDSTLWEGRPGHPWDVLRDAKIPRSATLNRFRDIPFFLESLKTLPDIAAIADFERLGMSGHSFGAMTTQVMGGMLFPDGDGAMLDLSEPRFKAGILYSPVPVPHIINDEADEIAAYKAVTLPLMHMTGTEDHSPLQDFDHTRRLWIYEHSASPEKYLQILDGGDHMVYNGTRGKLGNSDMRETHEELIKLGALGFWDAYLKDDEKAKAWLDKGGLSDYMGPHGLLKADFNLK